MRKSFLKMIFAFLIYKNLIKKDLSIKKEKTYLDKNITK